MDAIDEILRHDLAKPDLSEGYAEAFEDAYIATQIKVLREQNQWTQAQLANELKTTQTVVSRIENVNYSAWNIRTLKKLARAFRLRLHVSFETYGSLIDEMGRFSRTNLERAPREKDSVLNGNEAQIDTQTDKRAVAKTGHTLQQLVGNTGLGVPLSDAFFQAVNHPMLPPQFLRGGSMTLQNLAGLGLPTSAPMMLPVEAPPPEYGLGSSTGYTLQQLAGVEHVDIGAPTRPPQGIADEEPIDPHHGIRLVTPPDWAPTLASGSSEQAPSIEWGGSKSKMRHRLVLLKKTA